MPTWQADKRSQTKNSVLLSYQERSFLIPILILISHLSNIIQQLLRLIPSKTWVSNGLSVAVFADLVVSWLDVAFDHQAFYQMTDVIRMAAAVKHFFAIRTCSAYFLLELEWLVSTMQAGFFKFLLE